MKKILLLLALLLPVWAISQGGMGVGFKAGLNFAGISNASDINNDTRSGFMAGLFLAPSSQGIIATRHEIIYSKQGYNFKNGSNTGNVNLDYLIIPQLIGINITKYVQLQAGMQMAFLLNAKADSSSESNTTAGSYGSVMNLYNKFDYAVAAGIEIHPVSGLLIGARYNLGLGKIYKDATSGQSPSFSSIDARNNVIQVFAGWRFGKTEKKSKK